MRSGTFLLIAAALLIILACLTNPTAAYANAVYSSSSWSSTQIAVSRAASIIPEGFDEQPFAESITRKDFCELLINTCRIFGVTLPSIPKSHPFTDTTDINAEYAYVLGLTEGTAPGVFSPDKPLSREMAAVMLSKMLRLFQSTSDNKNENSDWNNVGNSRKYSRNKYSRDQRAQLTDEQQAAKTLSEYSTDSNLVSDWAKSYMADVYTRGILSGTGHGRLDPKSCITREQAVALSLNVLTYCDESQIRAAGVNKCVLPMPTGIYIAQSYCLGDVYLRWNDIPSASAYDVTVFKNDKPVYTTRTSSNYLDLRKSNIFGNDKQMIHAALKVVPVNTSGVPSVFSLTREFVIKPWVNLNEMIFGDPDKTAFANIEEANQNMTSIKVNVWKLTPSGTKTTSSITLTVHKNVAEDVKKIFADIYNGPEKFPIKSCSAYSYRNGQSEHSSGTAIDINPNENYFIDRTGAIKAGALWNPGKNPYSIPPDGDVVRAFNRYGWHWSPDMNWSNGADYMHFSLGGT